MLFSSRVMVSISVRIRFIVWLVSCCAHVFVLSSIVIVTLPSLIQHTHIKQRYKNAHKMIDVVNFYSFFTFF